MESDSVLCCYIWKKEMPQKSENFLPASPVIALCSWGGWSLPTKKFVHTPPSSSCVAGLGLLSGSRLALMVFCFSLLLLLRRKTLSLSCIAFFHLPFFSALVHISSTNNNSNDKNIRCSVHVSAVLFGETLNLLLPVPQTCHHPTPPN